MSLAYEHFKALREKRDIPEVLSPEDAAQLVNELVSECRGLTMSQLSTSAAKQLCSILFSHEGGLTAAYTALREPEIKKQTSKGRKSLTLLLAMISLVIALVAIYMLWRSDMAQGLIYCLFIIAAEALCLTAFFMPKPKSEYSVNQLIDTDKLLSLVSRRMEAIDRDLDAFLSIPTDSDGSDDSMVHIITLANSLKRSDPDSVPDELMTAISALSLSKGYEFLDYDGENEAFFDTMPTKRETRTIVPAVIKEQTLMAKGMAIVNINGESEGIG